MQTYQVGLIALAIAAIGIYLAYMAWRRQAKNQERILSKPVAFYGPADVPGFKCFYIATTFLGAPLSRVKAYTLGTRGQAIVHTYREGLVFDRKGELSFMIPASDFMGIETSNAVIGKAVEAEGLFSVSWRLGDSELQTHFRIVSQADRATFVESIGLLGGSLK